MKTLTFVNGEKIHFNEGMVREFKEVKGSPPVKAIGKVVDKYVVAFLNARGGSIYWGISNFDHIVHGIPLSDKMRDEIMQVAGQKISSIAPPVAADWYRLPFHKVANSAGQDDAEDIYVVEVEVKNVDTGSLFLTGSGEAYTKTLGGTKKLTGAELLTALITQLQHKLKDTVIDESNDSPELSWMPSVAQRAKIVRPLLNGARILWVDDSPANNLYERTALSSLNISVDLALSTDEALFMINRLKYDLIISDMNRGGNPYAGKDLLETLINRKSKTPLVYYVERLDRSRGAPVGAFAITNRPDELLHYVFDILERRE